MLEFILLMGYYVTLFLFGITMSFVFCDVVDEFENNRTPFIFLCVFCVITQLMTWLILGDKITWCLYPLLVHIPIAFVLHKYYYASLFDACISIMIAYFLCQPSKWLGLVAYTLTNSTNIELIVKIIVLITLGNFVTRMMYSRMYHIFDHGMRWKVVFCIVPVVYYFYDYFTGVYSDFFNTNSLLIVEFLPFVLCLSYFNFLLSYQHEYEQKMVARHNNELNEVVLKQQKKELESIKKSSEKVRLLRHDMRHLINHVTYLLNEGNSEGALKLLNGYNDAIESTYMNYYCDNEMLNYIISEFASRCEKEEIKFETDIKITSTLHLDDTILISILSNGIENAMNAQKGLNKEDRYISLYLKSKENKLLLSIKNPYEKEPTFDHDGNPMTDKKGHGYGVRSIRHMTESVGGSCEFLVKDGLFILRLVI